MIFLSASQLLSTFLYATIQVYLTMSQIPRLKKSGKKKGAKLKKIKKILKKKNLQMKGKTNSENKKTTLEVKRSHWENKRKGNFGNGK